ncbi:hypothetical protein DFQ29_000672, partial [Apophysomyces sp. BC1021]
MVHLSFDLAESTSANSAQQLPQRRRLWRLSKLKDENIREQYVTNCTNNLHSLQEDLDNHVSIAQASITIPANLPEVIEDITSCLYDVLYQTMDETLGSTPGGQHRQNDFWTKELQRLVNHREFCYKKWRRAYGMNKLTWWLRHQEAGKALRQRSRETWRRLCTQLETDDYSKTTATIKRIRQRRTIQSTFSHSDGPTAAGEAMARHLET